MEEASGSAAWRARRGRHCKPGQQRPAVRNHPQWCCSADQRIFTQPDGFANVGWTRNAQ